MTAHIGTTSIDGTPISQAALARIDADEKLHVSQQRAAVRVVAASSLGADDCRTLLAVLGIDGDVALAARGELVAARHPVARAAKRTRRTRAA